jgi:hypothetical protein
MARLKYISVRHRTEPSGKVVKEFIVQVNGKTHNGRHASLKAAKQTLRKVLKSRVLVPIARKKKKIERKVSHTVGLSFHTGNQRWVGNQVALGESFKTEAEGRAALKAFAQKQLKCKRPAASIDFESQGNKRKIPTSSSVPPSHLVQRVQKLVLWGERGRKCSGKAGFEKKNFPADLWCSLAHCEKSRDMYKKLPVTRLLSLQSKYGHAKDALLNAWIRKFSFNLVGPRAHARWVSPLGIQVALVVCKNIHGAQEKLPQSLLNKCSAQLNLQEIWHMEDLQIFIQFGGAQGPCQVGQPTRHTGSSSGVQKYSWGAEETPTIAPEQVFCTT